MSGRRKGKSAAICEPAAAQSAALVAPLAPLAQTDGAKRTRRRKLAGTVLEERIGYRFTDPPILEMALTHISALKGSRKPRAQWGRSIKWHPKSASAPPPNAHQFRQFRESRLARALLDECGPQRLGN